MAPISIVNVIGLLLCAGSAAVVFTLILTLYNIIGEGVKGVSRAQVVFYGGIMTLVYSSPFLAIFTFGLKLAGAF